MRALDYLHLQLRLEGMEVVNGSFLRQVEVVPGEELPILLIAQPAEAATVVYYHEAISPDLQQDLAVHVPAMGFPPIDPFIEVLRSHNLDVQVGHYKTYLFPSQPRSQNDVVCLPKDDPAIKAFGFDGFADNVYAIKSNGVVVSACVSARENSGCGEAWVYTSPEQRGQGLAQQVVRAWAAGLTEAGKVPFYSHKMENTVSAALAAKLGLRPVFEEIAIASQV